MTPTDEVGKCPECGSIDRGTRYLITPPSENSPLGTFCKNVWHHVPPEVHPDDFTDLEVDVILGMCRGKGRTVPNKEIAEQLRIAEDVVKATMMSIFNKAGLSSRWELFEFIKGALNNELRRRSGR
jgi:DNA-binding NarL/FixJ family response regulator